MEVNIYYQRHRESMEINIIGEQKWSMILEMLWMTYYNLGIDWKIGDVKIMRCPEKCGK